MSLNSRITKNSLIQLIGKLISLVLGLLTIAMMTRYLGQDGFGYYTTAISFMQVFGILVDFGLSLTAVQMISKAKADVSRALSNLMTVRIVSAVIFLGLAPLIVLFFPYSPEVKLGVLLTTVSFFSISLISVLTSVFQKELKMLEVTVADVIGRIILLGITAAAVYFKQSIYWFYAGMSIANLLNALMVVYYCKRYVTLRVAFDWPVWREILRRTWPMALSISLNLIYLRMDVVILSMVRGPAEVGLYGAAYRVLDILTLLPAVYMGMVLPHLTLFYSENKFEKLRALMQRSFNVLMLFAIPIIVGTFFVARPIMAFVAGRDFSASGEMLTILILAVGPIFITSLFGYAVVALDKQKPMTWGYLTTAVLTFVGYIIFIPIYGWPAAAWLTVFSEALSMVWTFSMVYRTIKFFPKLLFCAKSVFATAAMSAALYFVSAWPVAMSFLLAVFVYFGVMFLVGALKKSFWRELFASKEKV